VALIDFFLYQPLGFGFDLHIFNLATSNAGRKSPMDDQKAALSRF